MTMKEELEIWVTALQRYDANEFEEAITVFDPICDTSRILFNCGVIRATLGEHSQAIAFYQRATALDQYLAIAYFQQGVSNFLLGDFEEALANFNDTLIYLRGNKYIDYEQLGLKHKLWSCEAVFNRGLCYIYLQHTSIGLGDLEAAAKEKGVPEHDVIDDAIKEKAAGYTVFSIPVGALYRPNEAKIKNIMPRDYLGKARLVAQASTDTQHRRQASMDSWAKDKDDRPADKISFAASNLVRPGLRSRQQSEPPRNRSMFPPTPPPEPEKEQPRRHSPDRNGGASRSQSLSRPKPEPLHLGRTSFTSASYGGAAPASRRGTTRSASERPSERKPNLDRRTTDDSNRSHESMQSHGSSYSRHKLFGSVDHGEPQAQVLAQLEQSTISPRSHMALRQRQQQQRHDLIEEEEETSAALYDVRSSAATFPDVRDDSDTRSMYSHRSRRGPPVMQKVRVKVHANEDTRYIMIQPSISFQELVELVARKFAVAGGIKLKTRDEEGDMITMGDQDDLDMAVGMCREVAAEERAEMGKMEIWVQTI